MSGTLPNFLIIGAMRSGTTSLARYLGAHPEVYMAPQKEVHFFDRSFERGLDWYRQQFAGAGPERAIGEATQTYMYEGEALARMSETLPHARLIAILRDPVSRAYSHYWLNRALGNETLPFDEALAAEEERVSSGDAGSRRTYSYLDRGRYVQQLLRVAERHPRTAIHVVLFEELRDAPEPTYRSVCRFLEIDERFLPPTLGRRVNRFVTFRSPTLHRAIKRLPSPFRRVVGRLNAKTDSYPPMDPVLRADLARRFRQDNAALADWLGRDLSLWAT